VLKDYGERIQYSVFECLINEAILTRMLRRLLKILVEEEDKLRIYQLCHTCRQQAQSYGRDEIIELPKVYIV